MWSADNRYELYVNGKPASHGPASGDVYHWHYETVDLAPMLHAGRNTLAAVVWTTASIARWHSSQSKPDLSCKPRSLSIRL